MNRLLVPLARAMIARGVSLGQSTEALKSALVQAAEADAGADATDSRISLLTGLHRKDVKRLRAEVPVAKRTSLGTVALVLSHWRGDPEFADEDGPRPLDRRAFDTLVRSARIDMAPGTVLAAMQDQGVVESDADGMLHPVAAAVVARGGTSEMVTAFGATLEPHLQAAVHNLTSGPDADRRYDRALRYSHLSPDSVEALDGMARAAAQAMLEALAREAHALQQKDREREDATGRFVLGAYVLPTKPEDTEE